jgi:hypothetical protein
MDELNHHDGDGWQSHVPWLNLILMNGFAKPGTLKVDYIKLLRAERPCSGGGHAHDEWWEPDASCHWCGAAV